MLKRKVNLFDPQLLLSPLVAVIFAETRGKVTLEHDLDCFTHLLSVLTSSSTFYIFLKTQPYEDFQEIVSYDVV